MESGYANRHLFPLVRRSKFLPDDGNLSDADIAKLAAEIKVAAEHARPRGRLQMSDEARKLWHEIYKDPSKEQSGLLGSIVARAEAQVIRLALV
jgi:hypothetical protein